MVERILVPFQGEGSGVEELTWGQKGLWQTMQLSGRSRSMSGIDVLPPGKTIDDAVATLQFVMNRHQSLRTRLRIDSDGHARQVLSSSGETALEVVDAGDEDPAEVAERVRERYQDVDFDYENEWPVRMAVIRKDGVLTHAVAVYLHTAMDAFALGILMRDLANMAAGNEAAPVTSIQPLELARKQRTPASQRQCDASLRHLERVLRAITPQRFEPNGVESGFSTIGFTSPAAQLAVRALAMRHNIDSSPILLAAYAVACTRITGNNPFVTVLAVSNRFRPGFADSVSPLAQVSPCVVDVADLTLGEVVGRAWHAAMTAYKHAYYDPTLRVKLIDAVNADRGQEIDISCFFNDRREQAREQATDGRPAPTEQQIRDALPLSTLRWEPAGPTRQKLYLDLNDAPDGSDAVDITASADNSYLTRADMEALVRGMEAVLVEAALDPTATTGVHSVPASV
jgi:hypothetical protein